MDSVEFNGYNIVWFMGNLKSKNAKFNIDIFMGIMIVIFQFLVGNGQLLWKMIIDTMENMNQPIWLYLISYDVTGWR